MGGQPHRSLPKKSHMQRFGFRRIEEVRSSAATSEKIWLQFRQQ